MRKRAVLALMLIFALGVTSGCGLIVKDEAVDRQTTIIEVAGKTITKGEVEDQIALNMNYQEYLYSMYGLPYDRTSASAISEAQQGVVDSYVRETVLTQKKAEYGMDVFTEEELAALQEKVDTTYQGYLDEVKAEHFADVAEGEVQEDAVIAKLEEEGYPTKDALLESEKSTEAYNKLKAEIVKDEAVSDEELQAEYELKLEDAKAKYEESPGAYASDVQSGDVYYRPAGYRYVKNLLRSISDEQKTEISTLETQLAQAQESLASLTVTEAGVVEAGDDAAQPTEASVEEEDGAPAKTKEELEAEITQLEKDIEVAQEAAFASIQATVDEIQQKINDGADFDALVEEYGEDSGMKVSPAKEQGYLVSENDTSYVQEFKDAAMALAKVGDVSPAVRTSFGVHFIQYASDVEEGAVPLAEVKESLSAEMLTSKQDALFDATVEKWIEEADATIYMNRLD